MKVALAKQAHKYSSSPAAAAKNAPHGRNPHPHSNESVPAFKETGCFEPKQTQPAPKRVVRSDCENISATIRAVPLQHVSRGGSCTLIWPHFTWLNIENNYSNDGNEDLMTFTSRSSECGLLRVRASSNKWAV